MRFVQNIAARSGIFYGWFTLVGVMLIVFTVGGSFVNSFGVMLPVICEKFGWSRASVSAGLSIGVIAFGLPSPLFGMPCGQIRSPLCFYLGQYSGCHRHCRHVVDPAGLAHLYPLFTNRTRRWFRWIHHLSHSGE